jgi:tRNA 2-(methylsulfanyl)-N6-isopentenyladenosine37 hydroxylase
MAAAKTRHSAIESLPLLYRTPDAWARQVLAQPLALLNDHAWLEKKAASNALELLNRWPEPNPPENWVTAMTAIARDEVEHLAVVVRLLARRGGRLTRSHANRYASALRDLVRMGEGPDELTDRLMVSALIEARSCERFELLSRHCDDRELAKLYAGLFASEAGHYRVFIDLARQLPTKPKIDSRWQEMLEAEGEIIQAQPPGPTMHSGVSSTDSLRETVPPDSSTPNTSG